VVDKISDLKHQINEIKVYTGMIKPENISESKIYEKYLGYN
jgi:hypothetical protein